MASQAQLQQAQLVHQTAQEAPGRGRPKVLSLRSGEGGIQLLPYPVATVLPPGNGGGFAGQQIPGLEMELDRALGGVVVRYLAGKQARTLLVPMAHIRQLELAE